MGMEVNCKSAAAAVATAMTNLKQNAQCSLLIPMALLTFVSCLFFYSRLNLLALPIRCDVCVCVCIRASEEKVV